MALYTVQFSSVKNDGQKAGEVPGGTRTNEACGLM